VRRSVEAQVTPRAAACAAAAVVHCSIRRRLNTVRYSARPMASSALPACWQQHGQVPQPGQRHGAQQVQPGGR
jgi:hypothetical protein